MSKYLRSGPDIKSTAAEFEIRGKGDVWEFWTETISACGSEMYPWDPAVVKAIREFEPDFCPLWVTTTYKAPSGGFKVFGRHAIGIDTRSHIQEGKHHPVRVLTTCWGLNAGRRPIVVEELIQNPHEQVIPDLKVFGYAPLDWDFYYRAKASHYEQKKKREQALDDPEAEREAEAYIRAKNESDAREKKAADDEADYRFDFVSNKGQKIRDEILGLTHAEYRALGMSR